MVRNMKQYPKAQGLMAAWIRAQHERTDLVGELARVVNTAGSGAPVVAFRENTWREWALAHGLTAAHVEAMFKEYAYVSTEVKRACYDKYSRAQRAQCESQK